MAHAVFKRRSSVSTLAREMGRVSPVPPMPYREHVGSFFVHHAYCTSHVLPVDFRSKHSRTLWLDHLQFKAGYFASFSVPDQRSAYALCLQALTSKREETRKAREEEHRANGVFIMVSVALIVAVGARCHYRLLQ